MKKNAFVLLSIIAIVCISFISYSRIYKISDNKKQLEYNIKQFINRPTVIYNNIDSKHELNIDNKKYIFLSIDNILGDAELTKGINNKYKIESVKIGSGYFSEEIYKTNKGKYLIMKGKNLDMKIAYAKEIVDNKEYKISIPQQEYFLAYCEVPIGTQLEYPNMNDLKLYNKNDVDITNEMMKILFK